MSRKLKILLAASEVFPFAKTGGLGDVSGSLPKALHALGHDVRIIMPGHQSAFSSGSDICFLGRQVDISIGKKTQRGFFFQTHLKKNIPVYLVGNEGYYQRDGIYGDSGGDYSDNAERFIFFCRSVLEACKALAFQPNIIHCNDWHTGLIPAYLKTLYDEDWFANTRTVFTTHNLGYQGNFPASEFDLTHLPGDLFTPGGLEFYGQLSFLKSGLQYSDLLTTVSPSYSQEIQTDECGFGMEDIIRERAEDLHGILNGIDLEEWNPERDPFIKEQYSPKNLENKSTCKEELIRIFSLKVDADTPILGMVSRLAAQKGIELVLDAVIQLLEDGAAFVLLGMGDPIYENRLREIQKRHPEKIGVTLGYDEKLSHQIIAGSDLVMMPSQYEPCGLTQMYGLKYGTVPLVRSVGGLKDSIQKFNPTTLQGIGFTFKPFGSQYLLGAWKEALSVYRQKSLWKKLVQNGMAEDNSWQKAANKYFRIYEKALEKNSGVK